jgi:hypothetical protein
MTDTQLLLVIGAVFIAPHMNYYCGLMTGLIYFGIATCMGLGWI